MNKENSMSGQNQMSTDINQSTKGYSSRFRQLKAIKSTSKCRTGEVLPFRREKAAIVIQRFWRFRCILRKKLYQTLLAELKCSNSILEFQNQSIDNLTRVYEKDCDQLEDYFQSVGKREVAGVDKQANQLVKQMAMSTFKMQRKLIEDNQILQLQNQLKEWKRMVAKLTIQKQSLRIKINGEMQTEEQEYLRRIKEENVNLIRVSKQKSQNQKIMRERLIETYKLQLNL